MTGTRDDRQELHPHRKRALFRAWHRGTREMDLILGRFADSRIAGMSEDDFRAFEHLLEAQDADLLAWIAGGAALPASYDRDLFDRICAFHGLPANPA